MPPIGIRRAVERIASCSCASAACCSVKSPRECCSTKVATGFVPVKEPSVVKEWIEQSIVNHLVPNTLDRDVVIVDCPGGHLVAVDVPASRASVAARQDVHEPGCSREAHHERFAGCSPRHRSCT